MKHSPLLSVIIPTRNRASHLPDLLDSLDSQSLSPHLFEIIFVDNASTDNTLDYLKSWEHRLSHLRIIKENEVGSNYARNAGVFFAKAPLVAFMDDDCLPHSQWAERILQCFESVDSRTTCVTGRVLLDLPENSPRWYENYLENYLSLIDYGNTPTQITPQQSCSANLIISKKLIEGISGFDTRINRKSNNLQSNDETLTLLKLSQKKILFRYEPSIKVFHQIPKQRLTQRYFRKRAFSQGRSDVLMELFLRGSLSAWREVIWPSLYFLFKQPHFLILAFRPCRGPRKFERALQGQLFLGRSIGLFSLLSHNARALLKKRK